MPVYEYYCTDCRTTFESLRSMSAMSDPVDCVDCGSSDHVTRKITTFVRIGGGAEPFAGETGGFEASAGGCCGGSCGCH